MRNRNVENETARSGRAVTDRQPAQDGAHATRGEEPRAYAAPSYKDASLAAPAAGEVTDFFDEGDPSGGAQQGRDRNRIATRETLTPQGPKTKARNREILQGGPAGQPGDRPGRSGRPGDRERR